MVVSLIELRDWSGELKTPQKKVREDVGYRTPSADNVLRKLSAKVTARLGGRRELQIGATMYLWESSGFCLAVEDVIPRNFDCGCSIIGEDRCVKLVGLI